MTRGGGRPPCRRAGHLARRNQARKPPRGARFYRLWKTSSDYSGRQDAALYGSQDGCRYNSDAGARLRLVAGFACAGAASMRIYGVRSVI